MSKRLHPVFWAESLLAGIAGFLAVLTAVWPTWIEGVTGFDPDKQSGSLEWILVAGCGLAALLLGTLARREWRRAATAPLPDRIFIRATTGRISSQFVESEGTCRTPR